MEQVHEIIEQVTHTLGNVATSDVVVGTPQEIGRVTVLPISRVVAGFGGAGGEGSGQGKGKRGGDGAGRGTGGGSGGGAVVRPVAVVVFKPSGVEVMPIPEKRGKLDKLFDQLPGLIERFSRKDDD